jgi:3-hydroxyacyl-CoA dehydrogenase/enoyl-CoA hydratase/3-hydroxybutyryl-CoA epimerase
MATEGTPITQIDLAMKKWGMPMGPFELLDEIGLDVALHVLRSLSHVQAHAVELPPAVEGAVGHGWLGKKSGRGFYVHGKKGKTEVNDELARLLAATSTGAGVTDEQIQWRLVLPMVNEAARVLAEGVTSSADDIDLATVLGLGFAPFRGGLAKFAEDVGLADVVHRLDELTVRHGPRFAPAQLLLDLAHSGGGFPRPQAAGRSPAAGVQGVLQEVPS